jgi:hypothetical protein
MTQAIVNTSQDAETSVWTYCFYRFKARVHQKNYALLSSKLLASSESSCVRILILYSWHDRANIAKGVSHVTYFTVARQIPQLYLHAIPCIVQGKPSQRSTKVRQAHIEHHVIAIHCNIFLWLPSRFLSKCFLLFPRIILINRNNYLSRNKLRLHITLHTFHSTTTLLCICRLRRLTCTSSRQPNVRLCVSRQYRKLHVSSCDWDFLLRPFPRYFFLSFVRSALQLEDTVLNPSVDSWSQDASETPCVDEHSE